MNEFELDKIIGRATHIPLPEGIGERLEKQIDQWAAQDARARKRTRIILRSTTVAAALAGIMLLLPLTKSHPHDTFSSPEEAAVAAGKMLTLLSTEMNNGFAPVADLDRTIEQVNSIMNKHLK